MRPRLRTHCVHNLGTPASGAWHCIMSNKRQRGRTSRALCTRCVHNAPVVRVVLDVDKIPYKGKTVLRCHCSTAFIRYRPTAVRRRLAGATHRR